MHDATASTSPQRAARAASLLVLLLAACAARPASDAAASVLPREPIEWSNVWMTDADKTDRPRVLLIGDSICQGYAPTVGEELAGIAYVDRLSTSRGIADPVLFDEIRALIRHHRFALIHFNNGLHGIGYTAGDYATELRALVATLREEAPAARLILATSTHVLPGWTGWERSDAWNRELVESRNAIVRELAAAEGIPVDDLCAVTAARPDHYAKDKIHYNAAGYAALGRQVAACIRGTGVLGAAPRASR